MSNRIASLQLHRFRNRRLDLQLITKFLSEGMAELQELVLLGDMYNVAHIQQGLLCIAAPKLHTVHLQGVRLDLLTGCHMLRSLKVSSESCYDQEASTPGVVLRSILQANQLLEVVCVEHRNEEMEWGRDDYLSAGSPEPIHLPFLRSLDLGPECSTALMPYLHFGQLQNITMHCDYLDVWNFPEELSAHFDHGSLSSVELTLCRRDIKLRCRTDLTREYEYNFMIDLHKSTYQLAYHLIRRMINAKSFLFRVSDDEAEDYYTDNFKMIRQMTWSQIWEEKIKTPNAVSSLHMIGATCVSQILEALRDNVGDTLPCLQTLRCDGRDHDPDEASTCSQGPLSDFPIDAILLYLQKKVQLHDQQRLTLEINGYRKLGQAQIKQLKHLVAHVIQPEHDPSERYRAEKVEMSYDSSCELSDESDSLSQCSDDSLSDFDYGCDDRIFVDHEFSNQKE